MSLLQKVDYVKVGRDQVAAGRTVVFTVFTNPFVDIFKNAWIRNI